MSFGDRMRWFDVPFVVDPDLPPNCIRIASPDYGDRIVRVLPDGTLGEIIDTEWADHNRMIRAGNQLGKGWFRRMIAAMFEGGNP